MRPFNHNIIYFAKTNNRTDKGRLFGMYRQDKLYHTLITGKTGTGKTNLLETKILQEIYHGNGSVVVFDPNGDLIQSILEKYPTHREKDLMIIDPSDPISYGYNPIKNVPEHLKPLLVSGILEILQKIYGASWGNRIEHILRFCLYTLVDQKSANLADIPRLLIDEQFRKQCLKNIKTKEVQRFWLLEFPKHRADALLPILSKLQSFVMHPSVQSAIIKPWRDFSLGHAMNNNKVILISLSKGKLGADVSSFIGSFLITSLSLAAFSRANTLEWNRRYTSVYLDEFQNFTTPSLITMFSELRKYKVAMTVATQYLSALHPNIRDAVVGNVGSLITFRISIDEAQYLSKYLQPHFSPEYLASLPNYHIALTLMINGVPSAPFAAVTERYIEVYSEKLSSACGHPFLSPHL